MPQDGKGLVNKQVDFAKSVIKDVSVKAFNDLKDQPVKKVKGTWLKFLGKHRNLILSGIAAILGISLLQLYFVVGIVLLAIASVTAVMAVRKEMKIKATIAEMRGELIKGMSSQERLVLRQLDPNDPICQHKGALNAIETLYEIRSKSLGVDIAKRIGYMYKSGSKEEFKRESSELGQFLSVLDNLLEKEELTSALSQDQKERMQFIRDQIEVSGKDVSLKSDAKPAENVEFDVGDELDQNADNKMVRLRRYLKGKEDISFSLKQRENNRGVIKASDVVSLAERALNRLFVYQAIEDRAIDGRVLSMEGSPVRYDELIKARALVRILGPKYIGNSRYEDLARLFYDPEDGILSYLESRELFSMLNIASNGELAKAVKSEKDLDIDNDVGVIRLIDNFKYDISMGYALNMVRQCSILAQRTFFKPGDPRQADSIQASRESSPRSDRGYESPGPRANIYEDDDPSRSNHL